MLYARLDRHVEYRGQAGNVAGQVDGSGPGVGEMLDGS
jgi:hypothetical protein